MKWMLTGKRFDQFFSTVQSRKGLPSAGKLRTLVQAMLEAKESVSPEERPRNRYGEPGGLLHLPPEQPVLLLPDLHARREFLWDILAWRPPDSPDAAVWGSDADGKGAVDGKGAAVLERLEAGTLQLLSLGDLFHAESRARQRWLRAYREYRDGWQRHTAMDREMHESLGTAETLLILMARFPRQVHVLKGNHENITNHEGDGDHPFMKFVEEGAMVKSFMERFYGEDLSYWFFRWEQQMPLLARGRRFLVSHAAPRRAFSEKEIVDRGDYPRVTEGLIWTGNGEEGPGAVEAMLRDFLGEVRENVYITGHRPISGRFRRRGDGRHLQFHNPGARNLALLPGGDCPVSPERDMIEL